MFYEFKNNIKEFIQDFQIPELQNIRIKLSEAERKNNELPRQFFSFIRMKHGEIMKVLNVNEKEYFLVCNPEIYSIKILKELVIELIKKGKKEEVNLVLNFCPKKEVLNFTLNTHDGELARMRTVYSYKENLLEIAILEVFRKREGLGTSLINELVEVAKLLHVPIIRAKIRPLGSETIDNLIEFYQRNGFIIVERENLEIELKIDNE
ncbi:GNAT family N-acetyltransferase [Fictibacillus fluitans]|uniref:GNAT family N-acetyltransferase n=1 Tax=Fictibacillus fluitans TaxID=3058422 RepID=A0ABT8HT53_9BACL|nr:GNAT family N-acetyltransferase [Fictibacillus sp. NE201]MDN4523957.1 GNAT family N-acetyltransferase [Fictibacillus sp. NE201]